MLDLTRPKFFIPWHGEWRHQANHKKLAESMAQPPKKSLIVQNGDVIEISRDDMKVNGQVEAGVVLIDNVGGKKGEEVTEPIIRDRQMLSSEGIVVIVAVMGRVPSVEVISRGVVEKDHGMLKEIENLSYESLKRGIREKRRINDIRDDIFYPVRRYIRKATGRNPLIVPTLIEG